MNQLVRNILSPFASAIAGAILGSVVAVFLFGVRDGFFLKVFALVGAIIGAAPEFLRIVINFGRDFRRLQSQFFVSEVGAPGTNKASQVEQERRETGATEQEVRRKLLAAEHEARRPICSHCGKKTEPVFRHRKIGGGPDMRHHDNPVLCNRCFKPYAGVRPWNLPNAGSHNEPSQ